MERERRTRRVMYLAHTVQGGIDQVRDESLQRKGKDTKQCGRNKENCTNDYEKMNR